MTWEIKDRDRADQFKLLLHGESKAIRVCNAAEEGSGSERPIFENIGKVLDGAWHKLARGRLLTACVAPVSPYRARRAGGDNALAR